MFFQFLHSRPEVVKQTHLVALCIGSMPFSPSTLGVRRIDPGKIEYAHYSLSATHEPNIFVVTLIVIVRVAIVEIDIPRVVRIIGIGRSRPIIRGIIHILFPFTGYPQGKPATFFILSKQATKYPHAFSNVDAQ